MAGGEREMKENAGLTAEKTKIPLRWIQHNFPCFSITLSKPGHVESCQR